MILEFEDGSTQFISTDDRTVFTFSNTDVEIDGNMVHVLPSSTITSFDVEVTFDNAVL